MGYPVKAYRTSAARNARPGSQGRGPGRVLAFPERRMQGFSTGLSEAAKKKRKKAAWKGLPRASGPVRVPVAKAPEPFGLESRRALRRKSLAGLARGWKLRSWLLRAVALAAFEAVRPHLTKIVWPHPMPGWTLVDGRWGNPWFAGQTNAHTTGTTPRHWNVPGTGYLGDNWDGPPFAWAEYDSLIGPLAMNPPRYWDFFQVGKGAIGTGVDPRSVRRWLAPQDGQPALNKPFQNPWQAPYNPYWQGHGQPSLPSPYPVRPVPLGNWPGPMIDPEGIPFFQPQTTPRQLPYTELPHRRPNPYRAPSQQTQWGPQTPGGKEPPTVEKPQWPDEKPRKPPKEKPKPEPRGPRGPGTSTWDNKKPGSEFRPNRGERDKPPGRKVKERKTKGPKWLLAILNGATEFSDFLRALYKALPKKYQRPGMSIRGQWEAVFDHLDEINLTAATRAVLRDQLEDFIYGGLGTIGGKGAHRRRNIYDAISRNARKIFDDLYDPFSEQNIINRLGPNDGSVLWWNTRIQQFRYAERTKASRAFANDPVNTILDAIFGDFT